VLTVGIYGICDAASSTHDHAVTFMRNGRVLSTITLERYTGVKHDQRLGQFITRILEKWVPRDELVRFVSVNSFAGDSFISDDETFSIEPIEEPSIANVLTPAKVMWQRNGRFFRYEGWVMCHEFAHVASSLPFGINFNEKQLLVHIDGGASRSACSFWRMKNKVPALLHAAWDDLKDPVNNFNVGLLGRTILGLKLKDHLSIPGKLMGFAAYGKSDSFWLNHLTKRRFYLDEQWNEAAMLQDLAQHTQEKIELTNLNHPLTQTLAACIQKDFETRVFNAICEFKNRMQAQDLIYTGGAALNIPTNTLLEKEFGFGHVFIPPCTSDSGLSLGAAAWVEYINDANIAMHEPFLDRFDIVEKSIPPHVIYEVAKGIASGKIIALCIGGSEVGPRALGHRTILARPDKPELKIKISEQIKKREWYRPIAPALLPSVAVKALQESVLNSKLAPFMLGSYTLKQAWQEKFAGVMHVDGTIRAQIVHSTAENDFLYNLLQILSNDYGIYGVINTSFNLQGEPILHYPQNAVAVAAKMGIDGVVVNGSLHYS
jgi:carbamoyltransferase